jgi:hypothetical protein
MPRKEMQRCHVRWQCEATKAPSGLIRCAGLLACALAAAVVYCKSRRVPVSHNDTDTAFPAPPPPRFQHDRPAKFASAVQVVHTEQAGAC